MYSPTYYKEKDKKRIVSFMRKYNFITLVNYSKQKPWVTHLPVLIEERRDELWILGHMAKANPQWKNMTKGEIVLVIFNEPHHTSHQLYMKVK